jgi:hypothetical protein
MRGLTDAPVSMVTRHGLFCTQPSAIRLSSLPLDSTFSVEGGIEGDDAGSYSFPESWSTSSVLLRQSALRWPAFPHWQHTGRPFLRRLAGRGRVPVVAVITSRSLAGRKLPLSLPLVS